MTQHIHEMNPAGYPTASLASDVFNSSERQKILLLSASAAMQLQVGL